YAYAMAKFERVLSQKMPSSAQLAASEAKQAVDRLAASRPDVDETVVNERKQRLTRAIDDAIAKRRRAGIPVQISRRRLDDIANVDPPHLREKLGDASVQGM